MNLLKRKKQKKQIEVKIPRNAGELRIKHFSAMALAPVGEFTHADEGLYFLAEFLGLRYNQVLDFLVDDIKKMIAHVLSAYSHMKVDGDPPKEIELGGKKFYLCDPAKVGIGWHIDFKNCNIKKDPVRMACLFYLPEGYNYSDIDVNNNITHPIDSRYQLFADEFPLETFIKAAGFFLKRSVNSILKEMLISNKMKLKDKISFVARATNPFNGKRVSRRSRKRSG